MTINPLNEVALSKDNDTYYTTVMCFKRGTFLFGRKPLCRLYRQLDPVYINDYFITKYKRRVKNEYPSF